MQKIMQKKTELTASDLKWIALVTMIVDHMGVLWLGKGSALYWICRAIGRLAFPLYCFLLVEGFVHTRDPKKYLGRLLTFAVISEIPYDLVHDRLVLGPTLGETLSNLLYGQNVLFTLALGLIALMGFVRLQNQNQPTLAVSWCVLISGLAWLFRTDCSYGGVALICIFYRFRQDPPMRMIWGTGTLLFALGWLDVTAVLDFWLVSHYHGALGSRKGKWWFYVAYPAHLLILWCVGKWIF